MSCSLLIWSSLSRQSFLSLVNLLSSPQSVWELLGRRSLANKSEYTLREMPTSIPVSGFHTHTSHTSCFNHKRAGLHCHSASNQHPHKFILFHKGLPISPHQTLRRTPTCPHSFQCILSHSCWFCSTGFDRQADCCEFRCEDPVPVPLRAVSHIRPEVRLIFSPCNLTSVHTASD